MTFPVYRASKGRDMRLDGRIAIVTGAGKGIGRGIALVFGSEGAKVLVVDVDEESGDKTVGKIRAAGGEASFFRADVSREEDMMRMAEAALERYGRIDILCSNAGIFMSKPVAVSTDNRIAGWELAAADADTPIQLGDWRRVLDTNLTAAFNFARAVGPHMMRQKKGKVVITSSTAGTEGQSTLSAYCVSKAGLNSLTRCLASEWGAFNITVNAIAPGMIRTDMIKPFEADPAVIAHSISLVPLGRLGEPREVALLALFLASDASSYISGQVFTIDGGAQGRGTGI